MRTLVLSLVVLFVSATALAATEPEAVESETPEVVPSVVAGSAPAPDAAMHLAEVAVEERAAPEGAEAAQLGPRGGFWWLVGVVVVAGVILAVLL